MFLFTILTIKYVQCCRGDSLLSPNTFDPSEFPSLGANSTPTSSLSTRHNYVGMVKQPQVIIVVQTAFRHHQAWFFILSFFSFPNSRRGFKTFPLRRWNQASLLCLTRTFRRYQVPIQSPRPPRPPLQQRPPPTLTR